MNLLKNWDNKTWLSSSSYINSFCKFLLKKKKINKNSRLLDIGCGRGKIFGSLSRKYKLINKPIGIDTINHKDVDKSIDFKNINIFHFFKKNKDKFDLIMIKQTLHLINKDKRIKLIKICKNSLKKNGILLFLSLDTLDNQIPCFKLMKKKLNLYLRRDTKMIKSIYKIFSNKKIYKFKFNVVIKKSEYILMLKRKYISCLFDLNNKQINKGIYEIKNFYPNTISFQDILICLKYKN